jgi:glutamate synthase (NADPH/NADH) small chain
MLGVWAGGDIVTGAATVIQAMGAGRRAARAMKAYLGLRDSQDALEPAEVGSLFGIPRTEHGYARLHLAN